MAVTGKITVLNEIRIRYDLTYRSISRTDFNDFLFRTAFGIKESAVPVFTIQNFHVSLSPFDRLANRLNIKLKDRT